MTIHLTTAEWERINAAGSGVLFRPGECECRSCLYGNREHPPAEFVEAAAACETCLGDGWWWCDIDSDEHIRQRCGSCLDGKRRIAAVVPCDQQCDVYPCKRADADCSGGSRTVGHVVVTWGPLVVVGPNVSRPTEAIRVVHPQGRDVELWHIVGNYDPKVTTITLPPDIDPQTLIGQWALGVKAVA